MSDIVYRHALQVLHCNSRRKAWETLCREAWAYPYASLAIFAARFPLDLNWLTVWGSWLMLCSVWPIARYRRDWWARRMAELKP